MDLLDLKPKPSRVIGLTSQGLGYSLLKTLPRGIEGKSNVKPLREPIRIDQSPLGSSDDELSRGTSLSEDSELDDYKKCVKAGGEKLNSADGIKSASPGAENVGTLTELESSRIPHTTFGLREKKSATQTGLNFSPKRPRDVDDTLPFHLSKRIKTTYQKGSKGSGVLISNVHGRKGSQAMEKPYKKSPKLLIRSESDRLKVADTAGIEAMIDKQESRDVLYNNFKKPPQILEPNPETSKRVLRGSSRNQNKLEAIPGFQRPDMLYPILKSPRNSSNEFRELPSTIATRRSPRKNRPVETFKIPNSSGIEGVLSQNGSQGIKDASKGLPYSYEPPSSVVGSSMPSTSNDAMSVVSSLSSPPDSPNLDASREHQEFLNSKVAEYDMLPQTRCPVCRSQVDRDFLETFNCGKRLKLRQQINFCRAHKQNSALDEWKSKGYPKIEWTALDSRLRNHYDALDDILRGEKQSFYRNALEEMIKTGNNRSLRQNLAEPGFEALSPGYYGSRGARAMMESIMSEFSSKIRRMAASDKLISAAGVTVYIQAVLAPELAVLLIKEDMQINDDERARAVLKESKDVGELLNEEEDDLVLMPDKDEPTKDVQRVQRLP